MGEFHKREVVIIGDIFWKESELDKEFVKSNSEIITRLVKQKDVEEAWQEFPSVCAMAFHEGLEECKDCNKYHKWFEKWFGSEITFFYVVIV